ncbi:hypothetical protein AFFFEF_04330 [Methylorubrum extorquens]
MKRKLKSSKDSFHNIAGAYETAQNEGRGNLDFGGFRGAEHRISDINQLVASGAEGAEGAEVLEAMAQLEAALDDLDASLPPNLG